MTTIQVIIFTIGALSVVLGLWCLALSLQNMKLERYKNGKN